ncbi:MAG: heavy metal-responsive transcriptional regulator [Acidobacteria bacterium]|nr:heavy metal-responsive transcriptional regulator [Acidobacteriota bacterium]
MRSSAADETYQIGEVAARSGVTPDTVRYYERLRLLPQAPRTSGGFRRYTSAALERLRFIKQAQALGLTLQEIRDLVTYQDRGGLTRCRQVRDLLRAKLDELHARMTELEAFRATLSGFLEGCERTLADGRPPRSRPEPECPVIETLTTKER